MSARTESTLAEIRTRLSALPPRLEGRIGGWAGPSDEGSNLGGIGVAPPSSEPELTAAIGPSPSVLQARYYFWGQPPSGLAAALSETESFRRLEAVDLLIWEIRPKRLSIVVSSRNRTIVHRRDGAVASLEKVLQEADASIKVERHNSEIKLSNPELFLWLAVRAGDPQTRTLGSGITIDSLAGVSTSDDRHRPSDLRSGIDFERPAFLTAVAESDVLGPMQFAFYVDESEGRSSFELTLHVDGGFEIHKSGIQYPEVMGDSHMMRRAAFDLMFELIPAIDREFQDDSETWTARRAAVIRDAIATLQARYQEKLRALQQRL